MQGGGAAFPAATFQFGHDILLLRPADAQIGDETPALGDVKVARKAAGVKDRDPAKAKARLGWSARTTLPELVKEMAAADYSTARRDSLVKLAGFKAYDYHE